MKTIENLREKISESRLFLAGTKLCRSALAAILRKKRDSAPKLEEPKPRDGTFRNGDREDQFFTGKERKLVPLLIPKVKYGARVAVGLVALAAGGGYWQISEARLRQYATDKASKLFPTEQPDCGDIAPDLHRDFSNKINGLNDLHDFPDPVSETAAWALRLTGRNHRYWSTWGEWFSRCTEADRRYDMHWDISTLPLRDAVTASIRRYGLANLARVEDPAALITGYVAMHNAPAYTSVLVEPARIDRRPSVIRDTLRQVLDSGGVYPLPDAVYSHATVLDAPNVRDTMHLAGRLNYRFFRGPGGGDSIPPRYLLPENLVDYSPYRAADIVHRRLHRRSDREDVAQEIVELVGYDDVLSLIDGRDTHGTRYPFLNRQDRVFMRQTMRHAEGLADDPNNTRPNDCCETEISRHNCRCIVRQSDFAWGNAQRILTRPSTQ